MEEEDHLNADQIINNLSTTNMDLEEQIKLAFAYTFGCWFELLNSES
jgi:hypothetical protein